MAPITYFNPFKSNNSSDLRHFEILKTISDFGQITFHLEKDKILSYKRKEKMQIPSSTTYLFEKHKNIKSMLY